MTSKKTSASVTAAADRAEAAALAALLAAQKGTKVEAPQDKLDRIRDLAKAMRNLVRVIKDNEETLSANKIRKYNLEMKELPELFNECNINTLSIGADGNLPAVDLKAEAYYKAVLPKDENDDVLPDGLDWLEKNKHGDLIKKVYTIPLAMDNVKTAKLLSAFLKKNKIQHEVKRTVPWNTLTSFVKEMIEKHHQALPLEILGATVGRIVKMKPSKEK